MMQGVTQLLPAHDEASAFVVGFRTLPLEIRQMIFVICKEDVLDLGSLVPAAPPACRRCILVRQWFEDYTSQHHVSGAAVEETPRCSACSSGRESSDDGYGDGDGDGDDEYYYDDEHGPHSRTAISLLGPADAPPPLAYRNAASRPPFINFFLAIDRSLLAGAYAEFYGRNTFVLSLGNPRATTIFANMSASARSHVRRVEIQFGRGDGGAWPEPKVVYLVKSLKHISNIAGLPADYPLAIASVRYHDLCAAATMADFAAGIAKWNSIVDLKLDHLVLDFTKARGADGWGAEDVFVGWSYANQFGKMKHGLPVLEVRAPTETNRTDIKGLLEMVDGMSWETYRAL